MAGGDCQCMMDGGLRVSVQRGDLLDDQKPSAVPDKSIRLRQRAGPCAWHVAGGLHGSREPAADRQQPGRRERPGLAAFSSPPLLAARRGSASHQLLLAGRPPRRRGSLDQAPPCAAALHSRRLYFSCPSLCGSDGTLEFFRRVFGALRRSGQPQRVFSELCDEVDSRNGLRACARRSWE